MRINGKEIKNNQRMNYSEIKYINDRVEALVRKLEKDGYDVSYEFSKHSEASYITVNDNKVSFRNHDYFSGNPIPDHTVWLSRFETWTDAKNYFYKEILPELITEEKKVKQTKEEIIEELKTRLKTTTDEYTINFIHEKLKEMEV